MKRVLLISVVLAFVLIAQKANAVTVENVTISDTGGVTAVGEASASGSSEADADVRSFIRTEGSNTRVRVDIRTTADGEVHATSSERTIGSGRLQVRIPPSSGDSGSVSASTTGSVAATTSMSTTTPSRLLSTWENFKAAFGKLYRLIFFFW